MDNIRTCVITKKKLDKSKLLRLALNKANNTYIFDEKQKIQSRSIYILPEYEVLDKLSKNKKYKIEPEEFLKILDYLKKNIKEKKQDILQNTMTTMSNSQYLVYGVEECAQQIKSKKIKVLILPTNIKETYKNRFEKLCSLNNTSIVYIKKQTILSEIFGKNVNVVGITNKKVANGILKKLEG